VGRKEGLGLILEVGGIGEKNKNSPGERVLGLGFQNISKGHLLNGGIGEGAG